MKTRYTLNESKADNQISEGDICVLFPAVDASEIRQFRLSKNMTQEQFANHYGIHVRTLRRWEGAHENAPKKYTVAFRKILSDWMGSSQNRQIETST